MAIEILLPRLGWTMEEGTFVEWLKQDGDEIKLGDVLYTVESDKSLNEVEAFDAGILRIPATSPAPGAKIPVGTVLAYIVQPGEAMPTTRFAGQQPASQTDDQTAATNSTLPPAEDSPLTAHAAAPAANSSQSTISPRARRIAQELKVDWMTLQGSGRTGRIVERDVHAAVRAKPAESIKVNASPLAQRLAADLGVDLHQLAQSMPGKRIERDAVERAATVQKAATPVVIPASAPTPLSAPTATPQRQPMSNTRRVIAERMATSAHTTAPVTLNTEVDATELVRLREQLKADAAKQNRDKSSSPNIPSFNDLLAKISAHALREHPAVNVRLDGDAIVSEPSAHIGIAVDTERGLLVVVVRDVHDKTLRQIAGEAQGLIQRARDGKAIPSDLRGSTFTITNLGMYEIDGFTPIINLPECAILGVGRIAPKQVVVDAALERVAIRQMMTLSLTFDHRLVDGGPAARFLQRIKQLIEQPYLWLVQ